MGMDIQTEPCRDTVDIIGLAVDVATYASGLQHCLQLARMGRPCAVSAANTHIAAAARRSKAFGETMSGFDLVLPDGMPLVWLLNRRLRRQGREALPDRVYGPYFMRHAVLHAPPGTTHFFFGGSEECLAHLTAALLAMRPDIRIAGRLSPPYRAWSDQDHEEFARAINAVSPDFIWVALGGEKQEQWIIQNLCRFHRGVFFAVGDAFELLAGRRPFAPDWFQRHGLTWAYRLLQEPRRMWRRYFTYNTLFLFYLAKDCFMECWRTSPSDRPAETCPDSGIPCVNVLGVGVSSVNMPRAVEILLEARRRLETGYVCVTGVHGIIESQRDPALKTIHNRSFLTVPDGMPTVWLGHEQGFVHMGRVYGPDLMLALCAATSCVDDGQVMADKRSSPTRKSSNPATAKMKLTHFLYGSTPEVLGKLKANLEKRFPGIRIVGTFSPPFRALNAAEEEELSSMVSCVKPDFFWVGLSTPKQERFMAAHAGNPEFGIMLGVGAAFPIHAGLQKDAPEWIKNSGLQWFYRLCQEPRRLWRRYLDIVPTFLWLAALQLLGVKKYDVGSKG